MNSSLRRVRKRMKQRKASLTTEQRMQTSKEQMLSEIFPEEAKHGLESPVIAVPNQSARDKQQPKSFWLFRFIAAGLLFVLVAAGAQDGQLLFVKNEKVMYEVFEREFPFATVHAWYEKKFGPPLAVDSFQQETEIEKVLALPVNGIVSEPFKHNGNGVLMEVAQQEKVKALKDGIVLFVGKTKETDWTVKIQHEDRSISTYGFLEDVHVFPYQSVITNDVIATMGASETQEIFFSIEKDNRYLDPQAVLAIP